MDNNDDDVIRDPFNIPMVPHEGVSNVDWYLERMKLSGVTEQVANKCGFVLHSPDSGTYFNIPYFTIDGIQTTHFRHRRREPKVVFERDVSTGGSHKGKYWQPRTAKNRLYWPPIYNQRVLYNDPSCPMIICEGELKAVAAQMAVAANGTPVLVCGLPGTFVNDVISKELRDINYIGNIKGESFHRTVYLAFDWNNRGESRERTESGVWELTVLLEKLGAKVVQLKWELGDLKGEQKLDDWLVEHHGDLIKAMELSLTNRDDRDTELHAKQKDLTHRYARIDNHYIPLRDITKCYSTTDFDGIEAYHTIKSKRKQDWLRPHDICELLPEDERNTVYGRTFQPSPLGLPTERFVYKDGVRLLNVAPPAVKIVELGWDVSVQPFLDMVNRLCVGPGAAEWFLHFLGHCAQHPLDRGHHIIVFRDEGSTGKTELFQTLSKVFGPVCGPVGDAISSRFNRALEGKVIGYVSEVVVERREDRSIIARLKSISGDYQLLIDEKGAPKYFVDNYVRLMLATNMEFIAPVEVGERRWAIFGGTDPWPIEEVRVFQKWRDVEGGVSAIQKYLIEMDLTGFDIHEPAPYTEKRREMEEASAPDLIQCLQEGDFLKRDVWTATEIQTVYGLMPNKRAPNTKVLGSMLNKAKIPQRQVHGGTVRLRAVRNMAYWATADSSEWEAEYAKPGTRDPKYV